MTKLKNFNCDKTWKFKKKRQKKKIQIVKIRKNSNYDKTQKSKCNTTKIAAKLNCSNSIKKKSKTQIVIKLKIKFWQLNFWLNLKQYFGKNNLTPLQPMICTLGSVLRSCNVFNKSRVAAAVLQTFSWLTQSVSSYWSLWKYLQNILTP